MLYDKKNFFINRFMHQSSAVSGIIEHLVFRHKHSYQTAAGLLDDPQNLVLIFPQGKLYSNFVDQIHFEKGIWRIIEQAQDKFGLIFSATFIQYLKHKKPTATVYLKSIGSNTAYKNIDELTKAYQQHYNSAKESETKIIL
jgi:hypothetical protein